MNFAITIISSLVSLLGPVFGRSRPKNDSGGESECVTTVGWRPQPFLEPMVTPVAQAIRRRARGPVQHVIPKNLSSRLLWIPRLLALRPCTAKPLFLIDSYSVRSAAPLPNDQDDGGLRAGGYSLTIVPHRTESAKHMVRSIRRRNLSGIRTIAISDRYSLPHDYAKVESYRVDARGESLSVSDDGSVTLYSGDPLVSGLPNRDRELRKSLPGETIWLVQSEPEDGRNMPADLENDPKYMRVRRRILVGSFLLFSFAVALTIHLLSSGEPGAFELLYGIR